MNNDVLAGILNAVAWLSRNASAGGIHVMAPIDRPNDALGEE
jgi:hypothetical protein